MSGLLTDLSPGVGVPDFKSKEHTRLVAGKNIQFVVIAIYGCALGLPIWLGNLVVAVHDGFVLTDKTTTGISKSSLSLLLKWTGLSGF
jgi:hypothetical protein